MNTFKKLLLMVVCAANMIFAPSAFAQEAPDAMIRRISNEVLQIASTDPAIQKGNMQRMMQVVNDKIVPYIYFEKMTQLAAGRFWRQATPEQKTQLEEQFKQLLIYTYSGAMAQVKNQKLQFRDLKMQPTDTDVQVQSRVIQPQGDPIQLNYRVAKVDNNWKIYDVNVMGAWLIESYKSTFATQINQGGIDGLIKWLTDKNQQLASTLKN